MFQRGSAEFLPTMIGFRTRNGIVRHPAKKF